MAEEQLKIQIGADVSGFNKGVTQVETGLKNLQPAAARAGNVLTNLSRVASDAPFGFIAIQNNLEPLIQSFGTLQRETGSTGGAIKTLAASLAGPAGVAVAFSVVSSAVTAAIQKYGSLGNALQALTAQNGEFFQQQQQLASIRKQAAEDAGAEIAKLNVLSAVSSDVTNSQENRVEAAKKLVKLYGEYLPKISQEAILNGQAADAINKAKDAILSKALAVAAEKKLAEIGAQLLDNQLKQIDAINSYADAQKNLAAQRLKADKEGLQNAQGINFTTEQYVNETLRARNAVGKLGEESLKLNKQYDNLLTLIKGFAKGAGDAFVLDTEIKEPKVKKPALVPIKLNIARLTQSPEQLTKEINKQFTIKNGIQVPVNVEIPQTTFDNLKKFGKAAREAFDEKAFLNKVQLITNVFTQVFSPAIDAFFEKMNDGKNVIKTLGESIKAFVIGAIKQFIKLAAISGLVSLVTGVPFGTALKGVSGLSRGGLFGGGGFGGAAPVGGIAGAALSMSVSGQFVQRGTDLVAVINQSNQRIGRVG